MKKVILFGDSLLGKMNIRLIKEIEKKSGNVVILNCATGGMTTKDALERVDLLSEIKHDYTVISLGTNDIFKDNLDIKEYIDNMVEIIQSLNNSDIIIWLNPPVDDRNDAEGTIKFNDKIKDYYTELQKVFLGEVLFIDSFGNYRNEPNFDKFHKEDGVHLTDDGYAPFINSLSKLLK